MIKKDLKTEKLQIGKKTKRKKQGLQNIMPFI